VCKQDVELGESLRDELQSFGSASLLLVRASIVAFETHSFEVE